MDRKTFFRFIGIAIAVVLAGLNLGAGIHMISLESFFWGSMDIILCIVLLYLAKVNFEDLTWEVKILDAFEEDEEYE